MPVTVENAKPDLDSRAHIENFVDSFYARLLVDEHGMDFDAAVDLARECLGYTNHTLLPEALERWSEHMFSRILPRHFATICALQEKSVKETGTYLIEHGSVKMGGPESPDRNQTR